MSEKKVKLDKYHWHEAMDRSATITDLIETLLLDHPVFDIVNSKHGKQLRERVLAAQRLIVDTYQEIAAKTSVDDVRYTREEMIKHAFDFYYDMSEKMKVPFRLISENRTNAEVWFDENVK
jgi:hypothetical protein